MEEDGSGDQLVGEIVGDMVEGMKETKDSISTHLARGRGSPKLKVKGESFAAVASLAVVVILRLRLMSLRNISVPEENYHEGCEIAETGDVKEIDEDDLLDEDSAMEVSLVTGFEAIAPIEIANTEADLEVEMATVTVVPEFYLVDADIEAPPIAKLPNTKPTMKKKVQSSPSMLEFGLTEQILGKCLQSPKDKDKVKSMGE
ncbi:unnamed protein product [Brassica oleracea var. botrytis]